MERAGFVGLTALQRAGEGRLGDHALVKVIEQLSGIEARAKKA